MKLVRLAGLALRSVSGSLFRSSLVFFCSLVIAGFLLATILVVRGAQDSLHVAMERLGADIVVVQKEAAADADEALLMGAPAGSSLPGDYLGRIADLAGVAAVSPQLYLGSLAGTPYLEDGNLNVVAFDPGTDFTVLPWIDGQLDGDLAESEALVGSSVAAPEGQDAVTLGGLTLDIRARLQPTGTELDRSVLVTFDTARELARSTSSLGETKLAAPLDGISAVMVKLEPDARPQRVAVAILREVRGVAPVLSPDMFAAYRAQIRGLLRSLLIILVLATALAVAVLAMVFSLAAHQRRRQIGVLRALGATRGAVLLTLLLEAGFLALTGGIMGIALAAAGVYLLREALVEAMGFPFAFPPAGSLASYAAGGLGLALVVVGLAAVVPAVRIGRQEPASAMRE
jgi:putative ABC transport system permease protein